MNRYFENKIGIIISVPEEEIISVTRTKYRNIALKTNKGIDIVIKELSEQVFKNTNKEDITSKFSKFKTYMKDNQKIKE